MRPSKSNTENEISSVSLQELLIFVDGQESKCEVLKPLIRELDKDDK